MNVETIHAPVDSWDDNDGPLAVIVHADRPDGLCFFTGQQETLQVGSLRYPPGKVIPAHVHREVPRTVRRTQEVIHMVKGRLRVDLYTSRGALVTSREVGPGDTLILLAGGHGFETLEQMDAVYVKSGPYMGEADKARLLS